MLALGFFTLLLVPLVAGAGLAARPRLGVVLAAWLWPAPLAIAAVALAALLAGERAGTLTLPLGLPGFPLILAWDGMSGVFLFAFAVPLAAVLRIAAPARPAAVGFLIVGLLVVMLAADAYALLAGLALVLGTLARLSPARRRTLAGAWAAFLLALAWLAPTLPDGTPNPALAAMRGDVLSPVASGAIALALLLGALLLAGPVLRPRRLAAESSAQAALLAASLVPACAYLAARLLGDVLVQASAGAVAGAALPFGIALALAGGWAAVRAEDLLLATSALPLFLLGESIFALGIDAWARRADLAAPARDAFASFLLLALLAALASPVLLLVAGTIVREAGSRHLARLGGLLSRMPRASLIFGADLALLLPLGPGFFGAPLMLTALVRLPGLGLGTALLAALVALLAILFGLGAFAAFRLFGLAFFGPPRTPRASAVDDIARHEAVALAGPGGVLALLGLAPGAGAMLIAPAMPGLLGGDAETTHLLMAAPGCAGLVVLLGIGLVLVVRARSMRHCERGWEEGFGPPPEWLPFGDPATRIGPDAFGAEMHAVLDAGGSALARWLWRPRAAWQAARLALRTPPPCD